MPYSGSLADSFLMPQPAGSGHRLWSHADPEAGSQGLARAGGRAASDIECLSGKGTQPCLQRVGARAKEGGGADPDS